jgi:hypothetical protein
MIKKALYISIFLGIYFSATAQAINASFGETVTFVQGISPVINTVTVTELPNTETTVFYATDANYTTQYDTYTDNDGSDGFTWDAEMGQLPPGAVISAEYFDASNTSLGYSDDLSLNILANPQWLEDGSVQNVIVDENGIISFEGNYPIYNYNYTIPSEVKGIGGRSLDVVGQLIFNATYDINTSVANVINNKAEIKLNLLNQLPSYTKDIAFVDNCSLGNDMNLSFVVTDEISTAPIDLNMPKIKFPVGGFASISVDAGISLYATLSAQIVIGENNGQYGFIDNGTDKTKIIGVLTGQGFIRGEVSVLGGIGSASASLKAKARLGIGFDYVSVPESSFNPLVGGDLNVWGEVCYKTFWGLGPSGCKDLPSFYYGQFGDTLLIGSHTLNSFDAIFNTQSMTFRDTGTLVLPDFNPQPTFATRAENLYATWLEHEDNIGYLLFSKLNSLGTAFTEQKIVVYNSNSISNPKVGILPSGSAIITWSQSRFDATTIPDNSNDEQKAQSQDVWFAIYDNSLDSIVYRNRLGDDFSDLESGRAEGEAKISVGDNNDAMITWTSKDPETNLSDIWFVHLTETSSTWNITEPQVLIDLSGTNFNVGVVYSDSVNALAVWINDPDGDEDTYDNNLMFSEWDGSIWSNAELLSENDGSTKLKELSLASNLGYIALAWTSTHFENDNDFKNKIELEVYDTFTGDWVASSYFEDIDSLYYFQSPIASISSSGTASICYQVINMFPDTNSIDNGELYLYVKDLNVSNEWTEITENSYLCDTNTFIWELTAGFSGENHYYTMTQEYNDNGVVTNPYNGVKFGDPDLSMVLRGIQINNDLTVSDIAEPMDAPAGIIEIPNRPNFTLLNNYPNPFSDITTIEFQLRESADVQLEIFNYTGTKVANLLNTKLSLGIYKTIFKAGDLPNGMYFAKLTVDGRTTTGKLVLIK